MLECNANTDIVVHDNGNRLASLIYYEGDLINKITIGRNMKWGEVSSNFKWRYITIKCIRNNTFK